MAPSSRIGERVTDTIQGWGNQERRPELLILGEGGRRLRATTDNSGGLWVSIRQSQTAAKIKEPLFEGFTPKQRLPPRRPTVLGAR